MARVDLLAEPVGPHPFLGQLPVGFSAHDDQLCVQDVDLRPQLLGPLAFGLPALLRLLSSGGRRAENGCLQCGESTCQEAVFSIVRRAFALVRFRCPGLFPEHGGNVRSARHCSPANSSSGTTTTVGAPFRSGWMRCQPRRRTSMRAASSLIPR